MADALKYMVDENGDKTSVVVPLKTWEKINNEYASLQNKLKVLTGITNGLNEVEEAQKSVVICFQDFNNLVLSHPLSKTFNVNYSCDLLSRF